MQPSGGVASSPEDPLRGPASFRPGAVRLLAVAWWVISVFVAADAVWRGGPGAAVTTIGVLVLLAAVVYALFWQPAVRVDDDGVELVNVARTVRVPWAALEDVDTRWALSLTAGGRRWTAWAAPSSGMRVRPVRRSETPWADREDAAIAGSRAPGSNAGEAAVLVLTRWRAWQDRSGGAGQPAVVVSRLNRPLVTLLAAASAVALVGAGVGAVLP